MVSGLLRLLIPKQTNGVCGCLSISLNETGVSLLVGRTGSVLRFWVWNLEDRAGPPYLLNCRVSFLP